MVNAVARVGWCGGSEAALGGLEGEGVVTEQGVAVGDGGGVGPSWGEEVGEVMPAADVDGVGLLVGVGDGNGAIVGAGWLAGCWQRGMPELMR